MTLNRFLLAIAFILSLCITVHAQSSYEKVHLHLDKPYYVLGDTIWFKAYVVKGSTNYLSNISGALYVELINEKDSLIRSLKIPVIGGTSMGDFTLDEGVDSGNYRIRAYTQWMRNAGEEYFFDQSFKVSGIGRFNTNTVATNGEDSLLQSDIQFFPEGGLLVGGITSRLAFKVTSMNGLGINVKGVVLDQSGKSLVNFQSLHAGMGSFPWKPEASQTYTAKFLFPNGEEKTVPLPSATDTGYVLGVYQPNKDSILVRINTKTPDQQVVLVARTGSEMVFSSAIKLSKNVNSVWIEKNVFPTGIAQFTLLDLKGNPMNERLIFIKSADQMQLNLTTEKKSYNSREQVTINLSARDGNGKATAGTFSVSVVDESKVSIAETTEHTIFSNLLLKSELRGYVEKPNYYFSTDTSNSDEALDNLMLTQGYRRFESKEKEQKPAFEAEGLETAISGTVKTLGNKLLPNAAVTLISLKANIIKGTTTDTAGRFRFGDLLLTDSIKFAIQAKGAKNSAKVEIILDSISKMHIGKNKNAADLTSSMIGSMQAYIKNNRMLDSIYEKTGQLNRSQRLREVNISAKRQEQKNAYQGNITIPEGHADKTIDMEKQKTFGNLGTMLRSSLPNVTFKPYQPDPYGPEIQEFPYAYNPITNAVEPMKIILEGRSLDPISAAGVFDNTILDASDIAKIDIVQMNQALIGMLGGPAILIYSKKKGKINQPLNLVNVQPKGFSRVKTFYSPKYELHNDKHISDLRTMIYWNPNVKTYANGEANFSFFNADGPGKYKVIIEGINGKGELGRCTLRFSVSK